MKRSLKTAALVFLAATAAALMSARAAAFTGTDEERYEAQLQAARERGKDFRDYKVGVARFQADREEGVAAEKEKKQREAAAAEEARRQAVAQHAERDQRLKEWEQLEKQDEKARAEEQARLAALQAKYAAFKDRMRATLEREGSLSEAEELDVYSRENPYGVKIPPKDKVQK